jgi:hypothetical protein
VVLKYVRHREEEEREQGRDRSMGGKPTDGERAVTGHGSQKITRATSIFCIGIKYTVFGLDWLFINLRHKS